MGKVIRIFLGTPGTRPAGVLLCLIVAGIAEAVSYGTLVPLIALLTPENVAEPSTFSALLSGVLRRFGVSPSIGVLVALIVGAVVLKAVVAFAALAYAAYSKTRLVTKLREDLISGLISARWSYHADQRLGNIASAIASDTNGAGEAYLYSARFLATLFQTVSFLCVALLVSWPVTLFGLGLGAFLFVALRVLVNASHLSGVKQQARTADLVALLVDTLRNIKPLKAMDRKAQFSVLLSKKSRSVERAMLKRELARAGLGNAQDIISAVAFGIGLYVAAAWWHVPLSVLVGIAVLLFQLTASFAKSHSLLLLAVESEGGYRRSFDLIDKTNAAVEPDSGTLAPPTGGSIRFENVGFRHGGRPVLSGVNIEIPANSVTVLQGASGTGKTTLIDLLTGLHRPDEGRILVGDSDLADISLKAWRGTIGYVAQELTLLHASIADNITLGDETVSEERIWQAIDLAGARDFIEALPQGLAADAGETGTRLSGGQRQRIALARAIVKEPRLLVLDEVTSALDPETEREICERIRALGRRFTVVAITHRPAWTTIATMLYKVADGRVSLVPAAAEGDAEASRQGPGRSKAERVRA